MKLIPDILIVGAGSGGVAAAWAAAKAAPEKKVVLIEAELVLGGTSTLGGVNAWEPGCVGYSQLHTILYERLQTKGAAYLAEYISVSRDIPYVIAHVDRSEDQEYSASFTRRGGRRILFEPGAMQQAMEECLYELPNLTVITGCRLAEVFTENGRIRSVEALDSIRGERLEIEASLYIDATAEIELCRMAGCKTRYSDKPNGISQMYTVERKKTSGIDKIPDWVWATDAPEWLEHNQPTTIFNHCPDGKLNANTLCTMEGEEYRKLGVRAKKTAVARTYMIWNYLQKERGMENYRLSGIFPMLGIREGHLLTGRYVLDEQELLKGHKAQQKKEHFIAFADHAIDVHKNKDAVLQELQDYYGIPYECTLTNEMENLAAASRGISLTRTAAASCRLQRTIMQIGESVGRAAAACSTGSFWQEHIFKTYSEINMEQEVNPKK